MGMVTEGMAIVGMVTEDIEVVMGMVVMDTVAVEDIAVKLDIVAEQGIVVELVVVAEQGTVVELVVVAEQRGIAGTVEEPGPFDRWITSISGCHRCCYPR